MKKPRRRTKARVKDDSERARKRKPKAKKGVRKKTVRTPKPRAEKKPAVRKPLLRHPKARPIMALVTEFVGGAVTECVMRVVKKVGQGLLLCSMITCSPLGEHSMPQPAKGGASTASSPGLLGDFGLRNAQAADEQLATQVSYVSLLFPDREGVSLVKAIKENGQSIEADFIRYEGGGEPQLIVVLKKLRREEPLRAGITLYSDEAGKNVLEQAVIRFTPVNYLHTLNAVYGVEELLTDGAKAKTISLEDGQMSEVVLTTQWFENSFVQLGQAVLANDHGMPAFDLNAEPRMPEGLQLSGITARRAVPWGESIEIPSGARSQALIVMEHPVPVGDALPTINLRTSLVP